MKIKVSKLNKWVSKQIHSFKFNKIKSKSSISTFKSGFIATNKNNLNIQTIRNKSSYFNSSNFTFYKTKVFNITKTNVYKHLQIRSFAITTENSEKIKEILLDDTRFRIDWNEYVKICSENGVTEEEAAILCSKLEEQGHIFRLTQGTADFVYIDPPAVSEALSEVLDPKGKVADKLIEMKKSQLGQIVEEFQQLDKQRSLISDKAERGASRIIWSMVGFLTLQAVVVTRLTFWDLSWDIMEPITYMLTFSYGVLGAVFFGMTRSNPDYNNVIEILAARRKKRLFKKYKFNEDRYQELLQVIETNKRDLSVWGQSFETDDYIIDTTQTSQSKTTTFQSKPPGSFDTN